MLARAATLVYPVFALVGWCIWLQPKLAWAVLLVLTCFLGYKIRQNGKPKDKPKCVYVVLERFRSRLLLYLAEFNFELKDALNIYDRQECVYISPSYETAYEFYLERVQLASKHPDNESWQTRNVYMLRIKLDDVIEEGLINKEMLWGYSVKTGEILEGGTKQMVINGRPWYG